MRKFQVLFSSATETIHYLALVSVAPIRNIIRRNAGPSPLPQMIRAPMI